MSRTTLNLGIVAHVDAGKTTLTERLLYAAGVIDSVGSVDAGTTQTDSLELERARGITIKSAVVAFRIGDVTVNLIDTPGHPDFIAEVERALSVLDGAVLVVSAVEGVQPQTRLLMRALQRLGLPTLIFVNKIDRVGASDERVLEVIRRRLTSSVVPMGSVSEIGTRAARFVPFSERDAEFVSGLTATLAEHDDDLLAAFVADPGGITYPRLRRALRRQSRRGLVHPVFFGSALMGIGIEPLQAAIAHLLPALPSGGDNDGPVSGTVFKVERTAGADRTAYVRLFSGSVRVRERIALGLGLDGTSHDGSEKRATEDKITSIQVFHDGSTVDRAVLRAGEIGKVAGLRHARVGDSVGLPGPRHGSLAQFARPTLATVVVPDRVEDAPRLVTALSQLAEQDPLIDFRHDPRFGELSISLYGEVQKEVVAATLESDYGISVSCRNVTPLYVERPAAPGEAEVPLYGRGNPFQAGMAFLVEPGEHDSGVVFRMAIDPRTAPLYVYRTIENFGAHIEEWVRATLREGLRGWEVTDCVVTMTRCMYSSPDGPPSRNGPLSTPADYRQLTPIVLMEAVLAAGTDVCEPLARVSIEVPGESLPGVMTALGHAEAVIEGVSPDGDLSVVVALLPSERALGIQRALPDMTSGEGVMESAFGGYRRLRVGAIGLPVRRRSTVNPLDRQEYFASLGMNVRVRSG